MSILRKLRRSSKDTISDLTPGSRQDSVATFPPSCPAARDAAKLTFFDLPPELRNVIYELLANSAVLSLPHAGKRKKSAPEVIGLLTTSKQCRREYLPILFSTARVFVDITDFDFANLMRVVSSLYSLELKSLRENRQLTIRLHTHNCTRENMNNLRRWLVARGDSLDRLPWHYDVPVVDPGHAFGRIRLLRELEFYAVRLSRLQSRLSDTLQWELQPMVTAFDCKAEALDYAMRTSESHADINWPSAARGLSGGGLR